MGFNLTFKGLITVFRVFTAALAKVMNNYWSAAKSLARPGRK